MEIFGTNLTTTHFKTLTRLTGMPKDRDTVTKVQYSQSVNGPAYERLHALIDSSFKYVLIVDRKIPCNILWCSL